MCSVSFHLLLPTFTRFSTFQHFTLNQSIFTLDLIGFCRLSPLLAHFPLLQLKLQYKCNQILPAFERLHLLSTAFVRFCPLLPTLAHFCTFQHFTLIFTCELIRFCPLLPAFTNFCLLLHPSTCFCMLLHAFALSSTLTQV